MNGDRGDAGRDGPVTATNGQERGAKEDMTVTMQRGLEFHRQVHVPFSINRLPGKSCDLVPHRRTGVTSLRQVAGSVVEITGRQRPCKMEPTGATRGCFQGPSRLGGLCSEVDSGVIAYLILLDSLAAWSRSTVQMPPWTALHLQTMTRQKCDDAAIQAVHLALLSSMTLDLDMKQFCPHILQYYRCFIGNTPTVE